MTDTAARLAHQAINHGALQKHEELAGLLELLEELRPQLIVELGSDAGGTLSAWMQLAPRVIAVDLPRGPFSTGRPLNTHGAELLEGNTHDEATWAELRRRIRGQVDFLFIDADHTYDGVRADLAMYYPFLRPGGLLALHDVCVHPGNPEVGVPQLWEELKAGLFAHTLEVVAELTAEPRTWGGIGVLRRRGELPAGS